MSRCYEYLRFDQINTRDHFSDRVFHLYTGIHLNKVYIFSGIYQELYCSKVVIIYCISYLNCISVQFVQSLLLQGS